jgi:fission 1 protein
LLNRSNVVCKSDIYESDASRRRECLYYLALGHYKLKNYTESKKFTARLLSKEPGNMQALSLNDMIDEDVRKEGLIGMAIAGGAIAVIGGITIAALKSLRSR